MASRFHRSIVLPRHNVTARGEHTRRGWHLTRQIQLLQDDGELVSITMTPGEARQVGAAMIELADAVDAAPATDDTDEVTS